MSSLYEQVLKTVQATEKRMSVAQEKISILSRELISLGRQHAAERDALAALEKDGK